MILDTRAKYSNFRVLENFVKTTSTRVLDTRHWNHTAVAVFLRRNYRIDALTDEDMKTLYRFPSLFAVDTVHHFGTRILNS